VSTDTLKLGEQIEPLYRAIDFVVVEIFQELGFDDVRLLFPYVSYYYYYYYYLYYAVPAAVMRLMQHVTI
jgi:hypothetical protein